MIPRLERGPRPTRAPIFGRRRRQCGKRRTALWRKGWKRWWKKEGAMGRKRFDHFKPRSGLNKPNLFATGCHRLPPKSQGKQGVCRGLRPVAGCPLPAKERSRRSALVRSPPQLHVPAVARGRGDRVLDVENVARCTCPSRSTMRSSKGSASRSWLTAARNNCAGSWCCSTRVGLKTSCSTSAGLWRSAWIFPAPTPRAKAG